MKSKPKFDNQLVARALRGRASEPPTTMLEGPDLRSGLRVPATNWFSGRVEQVESVSALSGDDQPSLPEPGPWLVYLLQQRKEMKS